MTESAETLQKLTALELRQMELRKELKKLDHDRLVLLKIASGQDSKNERQQNIVERRGFSGALERRKP